MTNQYATETATPNKNNITVGAATVPYDEQNKAWVKAGGKKIELRKNATEYAKKLNRLIKAQQ